MFHPFLGDESVQMFGIEAGGRSKEIGEHAARLPAAVAGSLACCTARTATSCRMRRDKSRPRIRFPQGLDYPAIGPEHAFLRDLKRVRYESVDDEQALTGFICFCKLEGIIPALESAHAVPTR
jgi:tryptophan synthase beta chain